MIGEMSVHGQVKYPLGETVEIGDASSNYNKKLLKRNNNELYKSKD
jgi:hypothetical protein